MDPRIADRLPELLRQLSLKEKAALLSGLDNWRTVPVERLGIGSVVMTDGPHGVRANRPEVARAAGPATSFPTGSALAATWDPELIEQVGGALAAETLAYGCDVLLGPCVNIVRGPLGGRNFETLGEDPYLAGRLGAAYVKGVQDRGVGTSLKHYACNNQETERFRGNSQVDERALREIYLAQFEAIVKEARPWTVMCSYNRINGVYASQNHRLLTQILRDEWGFEGAVISDWGANHTTLESVAAGLDLEMPGPAKYYGRLLRDAVHNWQIDPAAVDAAAGRVLALAAQAGKIAGFPAKPGHADAAAAANTPQHQALALHAAEQAMVLLKNEGGVLQLGHDQTSLAVIGPSAADFQISGGGSSSLEAPYRSNPLQALDRRLGNSVKVKYEAGCRHERASALRTGDFVDGRLTGEYYVSADLTGRPARVEGTPKLDMWWGEIGPLGETALGFSARWSGELRVPDKGTPARAAYVFQLACIGRARLYLDGALVLEAGTEDGPAGRGPATKELRLDLSAARTYDLKLEFSSPAGAGTAFVHLGLMPGWETSVEAAAALAAESDVAVIVAGMPERFETEGEDRPHMSLPGAQDELIRAVARANPRTVVVLNCGAPVAMPWIEAVPAVVLALYPGMEGGRALARILLGDVNPSGKLPVTFPARLEDSPAFLHAAHPGQREVLYGEGIFVGYRYFDQKDVEPLFPFGHGLSYTTFAYGDLDVPVEVERGSSVGVTVSVTNTGARTGAEIVQLYVRDVASSLPRPPKELKGFARVSLEPGEARRVEFTLDERALAFYDPVRQGWVAEPGEFEVLIGSSSRDIRAAGSFVLKP